MRNYLAARAHKLAFFPASLLITFYHIFVAISRARNAKAQHKMCCASAWRRRWTHCRRAAMLFVAQSIDLRGKMPAASFPPRRRFAALWPRKAPSAPENGKSPDRTRGSVGAFSGGGCGIRTHVPVKANGFQDRLVMTASITLQYEIVSWNDFNIITYKQKEVNIFTFKRSKKGKREKNKKIP